MNGDGTEAGDRQAWRPGWGPEKGGVGLCSSSSSGDGVGTGLRETKVPEMRQDSRLGRAVSSLGCLATTGEICGPSKGAHLLATRQGYPRGSGRVGWGPEPHLLLYIMAGAPQATIGCLLRLWDSWVQKHPRET